MFETNATFENKAYNPFKPTKTQHWFAMSLDQAQPWFVLTTVAELIHEAGLCDRTTLIADESTLLGVLKTTAPEVLVSLHCVMPGNTGGDRGRWDMVRVSEVWQPAEAEGEDGRLLICKFWEEETCFDPSRSMTVESVLEGRLLLARFEVPEQIDED